MSKVLKSFERACNDISRSITVVGYAAAAYLVMSGVSKLIEARNSNKRLKSTSYYDDDDHEEYQKRNTKMNDGEKANNKDNNADIDEKEGDTSEGGVAKDGKDKVSIVPDRNFAQYTTTAKHNTMVGGEMNDPDPTAPFSQIYNIPP